jgi:hypothetical protein
MAASRRIDAKYNVILRCELLRASKDVLQDAAKTPLPGDEVQNSFAPAVR